MYPLFLLLLHSGASLVAQGLTPLHMAAHQGHAGIVNQLCRVPRVEVDALDNAGCTPLHHATALGHDGVVMELWSRSANVDLADTNGWTGMHTHMDTRTHMYTVAAFIHWVCIHTTITRTRQLHTAWHECTYHPVNAALLLVVFVALAGTCFGHGVIHCIPCTTSPCCSDVWRSCTLWG